MSKPGFIYAIAAPGSDRVKIGYAGNVCRRLAHLRTASADDLRVIGVMPGSKADEGALHDRFSALRIRREWFWLKDDVARFVGGMSSPEPSASGAIRKRAKPLTGFAAWLDELEMTDEALASKIGLSRSMVTRLRLGQAAPSAGSAIRIMKLSGDRLELPDFFRERPRFNEVRA